LLRKNGKRRKNNENKDISGQVKNWLALSLNSAWSSAPHTRQGFGRTREAREAKGLFWLEKECIKP
jgi:hypothetical protein